MAIIGTANKWSLYVVRKASDPPTDDTPFTDYTPHTISFLANGGINKLGYFETTLIDISTNDEKLDIAKGNLIYIMSGTKLVGKYVLSKPKFRTDFTVKISGYQSTGANKSGIDQVGKLSNQTMPKLQFDDMKTCDILCSTTNNCEGILVNAASDVIIKLNATNCGHATCRYSIKFDFDNRIETMNKLVSVSKQEWWLTHGTNDTKPYCGGDEMNVASAQGTPGSTATDIYFCGSNMNSKISDGGESIESNANHIVLEGQTFTGQQVEGVALDSNCIYTCIKTGLGIDGWLCDNVTETDTLLPLTWSSMLGLYYQTSALASCDWDPSSCDDYMLIKIDDEIMGVCDFVGGPPSNCLCAPSTGVWGRGICGTTAVPHTKGADVVAYRICRESGSNEGLYLCVDCTDCVCDASNFLIGSECIGNSGVSGANKLCIEIRNFAGSYSHGEGMIVRDQANTVTNPAANDNSIYCNGLLSRTVSDNSPLNRDALDIKAQWIMLNRSLPIKDLEINVVNSHCMWKDVDIGDRVELCDGGMVGLADGCCVRITGFEFSYDGGWEDLKFYANQATMRSYPSNRLDYVSEKQTTETPRQQAPIRYYNDTFIQAADVGCTNAQSAGNKRITNVMNPLCDFDAANKNYVDISVAAVGFWQDGSNPFIVAKNNCGICVPIVVATNCVNASVVCASACVETVLVDATNLCVNDIQTRINSTYCIGGDDGFGGGSGKRTYKEIWSDCFCSFNFYAASYICSPALEGTVIMCAPLMCGDCFVGGNISYGCVNCASVATSATSSTTSTCATNICNKLGGATQGYDILDICAGPGMTISTNGSGVYTFCASGYFPYWTDGTDPYIVPCNSCGLCMAGDVVSSNSTNCIGCAASPGAWKELHVLCVLPATLLSMDACNCSGGNICFYIGATKYMEIGTGCICLGPTKITGVLKPNTDNTYCIGESTCRWKETHIQCGIYYSKFKLPVGQNMY